MLSLFHSLPYLPPPCLSPLSHSLFNLLPLPLLLPPSFTLFLFFLLPLSFLLPLVLTYALPLSTLHLSPSFTLLLTLSISVCLCISHVHSLFKRLWFSPEFKNFIRIKVIFVKLSIFDNLFVDLSLQQLVNQLIKIKSMKQSRRPFHFTSVIWLYCLCPHDLVEEIILEFSYFGSVFNSPRKRGT